MGFNLFLLNKRLECLWQNMRWPRCRRTENIVDVWNLATNNCTMMRQHTNGALLSGWRVYCMQHDVLHTFSLELTSCQGNSLLTIFHVAIRKQEWTNDSTITARVAIRAPYDSLPLPYEETWIMSTAYKLAAEFYCRSGGHYPRQDAEINNLQCRPLVWAQKYTTK